MSVSDRDIMKSVPIGKDDFKSLRDNDCYFVDKSGFIEEIMKRKGTEVFLFTRPRRFGKSLNMSMIDAFFNINYKGNHWFDGLKVMNCKECVDEMNSYPVISLTLKGLAVNDYATFQRQFKNMMKEIYDRYSFLRESDRITSLQRNNYIDVLDKDYSMVDPSESLFNLTKMLNSHYGTKCIVLIDEYDNPIQNSYGQEIQKDIIEFMRGLLTKVLKSNEFLRFGIVTGVMQIAKESIFSGLNNLYVNNIFDHNFDEYFGFTESEVKDLLTYYGHPDKFDECRQWYDGYTFGNVDVYNPWSLLNYVVRDFKADRYWAGTSGNSIIQTLLNNADDDVWDNLSRLSMKDTVTEPIDQYVVYSEIEQNTRAIYSIMAMSGYLKAKYTGYDYELSIPNEEIFSVYSDMLFSAAGSNKIASKIKKLFDAMQKADEEFMESSIHELISETISAKVLDSEHAYQAYIIGMMMGFCGSYRIHGDTLESGDGFADIIFERQNGPGMNIIIELKRSDDEKDLEKDAQRAMDQILDRNYMQGLEGRTMLYGVSFYKKKPYIIVREYCG